MAQVTEQGTLWNLPNFSGELYTADATKTPLLAAIGMMANGGIKLADNFEFPTSSEFDFAAAAQPAITETQSLTASSYRSMGARSQVKNVAQIFMQNIVISYEKLAGQGRLLGINSLGQSVAVQSELNFQVKYALQKIARDLEYTLLNGTYAISTSAAVANGSRGIVECASDASNTVAAGAVKLTKTLLDELWQTMAGNGAAFQDMEIHVNAFQKLQISNIYSNAPTSKTEGGVAIEEILTDFGTMKIVYNRFAPAATLIAVDKSVLGLVYQEVPGKGVMFLEELGKTGASEDWQLFGKVGLDHGPTFAHGTITGLATA